MVPWERLVEVVPLIPSEREDVPLLLLILSLLLLTVPLSPDLDVDPTRELLSVAARPVWILPERSLVITDERLPPALL